jgi:hypothetical protein
MSNQMLSLLRLGQPALESVWFLIRFLGKHRLDLDQELRYETVPQEWPMTHWLVRARR